MPHGRKSNKTSLWPLLSPQAYSAYRECDPSSLIETIHRLTPHSFLSSPLPSCLSLILGSDYSHVTLGSQFNLGQIEEGTPSALWVSKALANGKAIYNSARE